MLTRLIKKAQQPLLILTLLLMVITSCKKKDTTQTNSNTTPPPVTNTYYFTWKIKGTDYSIASPIAKDSIMSGSHYYIIHNNNVVSPANQLILSVFPFNPSWGLESAEYIDGSYNDYSSSDFVITNLQLSVTKDSVNKIISGTFSFPLLNTSNNLDTVKITNGKFKVKYN